jgi:hypothetical protein
MRVRLMAKTREELASLKCVPCRGDQPLMKQDEIKLMLGSVSGWTKAAGKIDADSLDSRNQRLVFE